MGYKIKQMITDNFDIREFQCKCCGQIKDNVKFRDFVAKLQDARNIAKIPFNINSGYRCERHNAKVGGVKDSSHNKGLAVDIECRDDASRYKVITALLAVGFNRFGLDKNFIHVDNDTSKNPFRLWLY